MLYLPKLSHIPFLDNTCQSMINNKHIRAECEFEITIFLSALNTKRS